VPTKTPFADPHPIAVTYSLHHLEKAPMNRTKKINVSRLAAWTAVVLTIALTTPALGDEPSSRPAGLSMADLIRQYQADARSIQGAFQLPASTTALDRMQRFQATWLKRLGTMDFQALDRASKLDYLLLHNEIQRSTDDVAQQRKRLAEIDQMIDFRETILALDEARRQGKPIDSRAAAEKLSALTAKVKQLRDRIDKARKPGPVKGDSPVLADTRIGTAPAPLIVSPGLALRAAEVVKALQGTLDGWYQQYNGYLPEFDWWVKQPYEDARKQLVDYAKLLREELAGQKGKPEDPLVGQPIGRESIAADVRCEFLPCTDEELIAIGEHELVWCEGQMREASRQMGLGDDWKAALAKVKADFVPPGRQAELIAAIGREATAFAQQRRLVTVPALCQETWGLHMMPPETLKTVPYAAYSRPQMMVAYAQQSMPQDDKLMVMRGNNRHFMRLVTPHELIPGHHLQNFYAARYNTQRAAFSTPFYGEGWAFYWELRLWDLGWAKTPEDRIGMLFWRMTRAARIIVSLKYHLGRMKPAEMVEFLINRVGHEKFGATAEVRRFIAASPLYQVGYMIGGLQLYALHKELVGAGKMAEERFHDAVLKEGSIPIELLRADLRGLPLPRDMQPTWKFADEALRP
jgi:uncharacterized protein (DUF885 family)